MARRDANESGMLSMSLSTKLLAAAEKEEDLLSFMLAWAVSLWA